MLNITLRYPVWQVVGSVVGWGWGGGRWRGLCGTSSTSRVEAIWVSGWAGGWVGWWTGGDESCSSPRPAINTAQAEVLTPQQLTADARPHLSAPAADTACTSCRHCRYQLQTLPAPAADTAGTSYRHCRHQLQTLPHQLQTLPAPAAYCRFPTFALSLPHMCGPTMWCLPHYSITISGLRCCIGCAGITVQCIGCLGITVQCIRYILVINIQINSINDRTPMFYIYKGNIKASSRTV